MDTVPDVDEKPDYARMAALMRETTAALQRIAPVVYRLRFGLLDHQLAETPFEDRPDRSWEVEREEFLRRLDDGGPIDG